MARDLPDGGEDPFDDPWCIGVADGDRDQRVVAARMTVADGVVGTRGVLEEDGPVPGSVIVGGVYQPDERATEAFIALDAWTGLGVTPGAVGRRVLNLRDGMLERRVGPAAAPVYTSRRFASIARPGVAVQVVEGSTEAVPPDAAGGGHPPLVVPSTGGGGVARAVATSARTGEGITPVRIERVVAHVTSPVTCPDADAAKALLDDQLELGADGLAEEHRRAWHERWAAIDVETVGDPRMTNAVRYALYHLLTAGPVTGESAIGPRGLTGPAYAGHVLWDADAFALPVLAATEPDRARAVLAYRSARLGAAHQHAALRGGKGARFPWESARDGHDVTPHTGIDEHGTVVPILTGELEEHVTADVAWAAWHYASWTGDTAFLDGDGRRLLLATARYWASRVRVDGAGAAHIDHVIGPDEYHEDVDDNAFTNGMAAWNLRRAADLAGDGHEAASWRRTADALVDGYDPATGIYEQFDGYHRLDPVMAADLGPVPLSADLFMGKPRLVRSQIIKQADVLMLHHLVPDDVVPGSLVANLEHYLPRTVHGSTLSPSVHASLLARAGRPEDALELLRLAVDVDREDLTRSTAGGLHLANLAGIWRAVVTGFGGVSASGPASGVLSVDPVLPDDWDELRIGVRHRGAVVRLWCRRDGVRVECTAPLVVSFRGTTHRVDPPGGPLR